VYLAARVRPLTPREMSMGSKTCIVVDGNCTTIVNPETGDAKAFVLDYSYDSSDEAASRRGMVEDDSGGDKAGCQADNYTIFKDIGTAMLMSSLDGLNTCFFAHGQSGTGKTYTLIGEEADPGLLPRLLEALFQQDAVISGDLEISVKFIEVGNEQVRDMMQRDFYSPGGLRVRQREGVGAVVEGLSATALRSMSDCEDFLAEVLRSLGSIAVSSHSVFTIELFEPDPRGSSAKVPLSKMHLVDLASSASSSDAGNLQMKSSATLQDRSLLAWANVMSALAENQMEEVSGRRPRVFVPYRGSVLTRVLEDSMGPRSRSFVVATLSPSHLEYRSTLNTFRHVVRAKEVRRVAPNDAILRQYMGDQDLVPAAGGGWRWAYCPKDG